jgi:two-component system chemotaxis response regulator CheB
MIVDPIRVLVIDDSPFSRRTLTRILESSPCVRVVGFARDGREALRKTLELQPDLVTLDLEMPRMDGFTFLRLVMAQKPTPVLVVSGRARSQDVFQALELGAVDFVAKPASRATPELEVIREELLRKVHALRDLRIHPTREELVLSPETPSADLRVPGPRRLVVLGASTGGPTALMRILGAFPEPAPFPILVSQHMPEGFTAGFADRIDRRTAFSAGEARCGDRLVPGRVLVAPGGRHLELESCGSEIRVSVVPRRAADAYAPSIDRMFESAAKHFGSELLAVLLTGMGDDGARGVTAVKESGGGVVAESEESAVVFGMPQQAIRTGCVDFVLPLASITATLVAEAGKPRSQGAFPVDASGGARS